MVGQGALFEYQAEDQLHGTDDEKTLYRIRDNYWKELAEECVGHGVGVSLVLFPSRYIDAATLGTHIGLKPAVLLTCLCRRRARDHGW
jgi:protein transport protein SEC24